MTHGLTWIEASAGTGKTYTLTQTVLELVMEGRHVRQILLVTFTRKAAEELKTRIRQGIRDAWKNRRITSPDSEETLRLEKALEDFSQLTIQTIHGFCHLALGAFPLESGLPFEAELLSAGEDRHHRVRALVREKLSSLDPRLLLQAGWTDPEDLTASLEEALEKDYFAQGVFQPDPEFEKSWEQLYLQLTEDPRLAQSFLKVQGFVCQLPENSGDYFPEGMVHQKNTAYPYRRMKALETLEPGPDLLCLLDEKYLEYLGKWFPPFHPRKGKTTIYNKAATPDRLAELPRWSELIDALDDFLPRLTDLAQELGGLSAPAVQRAMARFHLLRALTSDFQNPRDTDPWKEGDGLTYDRMIKLVHQKVCGEERSGLGEALARRWTTALIDEFQDTDRLQWDIFRHLFDRPGHRLILVGDPKQSIYGFRGADLRVYTEARRHTEIRGGRFQVLDRNYRSTDGLITGVNRLFQHIFPDFTPSQKGNSPAKDTQPLRIGDRSLPPVRLLRLEDSPGQGAVLGAEAFRRQVFRHCVRDIITLLDSAEGIKPDHILVLTDKNSDSAYLLSLLTEKGVPAVSASDQGIFQSPQAPSLLLFLQALESPRSASAARALLLAPVFPPWDGQDPEEVLVQLQDRLLEAQGLRERGAFLEAFRHLIPSNQGEGGVLDHLLTQEGGERAYTNTLHLWEILQESCRAGHFPALRAAAWFEAQMESSTLEEVSLRIDRQSPAVRIMTIHKAKGLEAPAVFFCAGMGFPRPKEPPFSAGGPIDFLGTPEGRTLAQKQEWEERQRLFYVAFTRPQSFLWAVQPSAGKKRTPWERFFQESTEGPEAPWSDKSLTEQVSVPVMDYQDWKALAPWGGGRTDQEKKDWFLRHPKPAAFFYPRIASHTALVRNLPQSHPVREGSRRENDEEDRAEDPLIPPGENDFPGSALPAGAEFGTLVHEMMELLDFRAFATSGDFPEQKAQRDLFDQRLAKVQGTRLGRQLGSSGFDKLWNFLGQILTLNLQLPGTSDFRLCQLAPDQTRREVEFHLKLTNSGETGVPWSSFWPLAGQEPVKLRFQPGYLTGWIDLLFVLNGKYYIADWKTNRLTPEQTVEEVMRDSFYDLQALLYAQAVQRFPSWESLEFGGVVYLFLRNGKGQPQALFLSPQELSSRLDFQNLFPAGEKP